MQKLQEVFDNVIYSSETYRVCDNDIHYILQNIKPTIQYSCINTTYKYIDIPCSFDIETSSFYSAQAENEKVAIMYEWTFGICGYIIVGRYWSEFLKLLDILYKELCLFNDYRLIIYVHNLGYEFQFIRTLLEWQKVFSNKPRKPIYALTTKNIEFRCSYLLSGYNLNTLGKNLMTYKSIKKLVGDLDYDLIRTPETPLTKKELQYCINDVKVVMCYIMELLNKTVTLANTPITKTGFVRRFVRDRCFYEQNKSKKTSYYKKRGYNNFMSGLTLTYQQYEQHKRAFQGGFVHANAWYVGKIMKDITSIDFTSSYPYIMVVEKFPMSPPELYHINSMEDFRKQLSLYCCIFDIEISNVRAKVEYENYLSISRCRNIKGGYIVNNGRIVAADKLCTTMTEQDFMIFEKFYDYDKCNTKIYNFHRMRKAYLPKDIVLSILELYCKKTELKGVAGMEEEYLNSKEMVNCCYGMMVTDVVRDDINYINNEWKSIEHSAQAEIDKYNNSTTRFLYYPWGVWVTAYARRNLFTGIYEFKDDYVYSDTDSIKVKNYEKHTRYVKEYNKMVINKTKKALEFHNIPFEMSEPKTIKGIKKPLGVWDFDGHYTYFKTLGAKRYMVKYSMDERNGSNKGETSLTVAGVNKHVAIPYLKDKYGEKIFENFNENLEIPAEYSGSNTHTYIDEKREGIVKDYKGNYFQYKELTAVHLEKSAYKFSIGKQFADYLKNLQPLD